ncbi:MAG: ComF family protein [Pseudomonadales bacterium]|nr:ComF family protein [Pseudomonadales bacterium]
MRLFFNHLIATQALCLCCQYQKQEKFGFCVACYQDLPHLTRPCLYCGLTLNEENLCTCHPEDWPFIACLSAFDYQFPINKLIGQYKNQARLSLCQSFAQSLAAQITQHKQPLPELLIPVPLSPQKLAKRGFNQSLELAKDLGKILSIPVDYHLLQTVGQDKSQKELSKKQRQNLNAEQFYLSNNIQYTHIAIIDDVITTGATVKSIAYLLRQQGATHLQAWSIARVNATKQ